MQESKKIIDYKYHTDRNGVTTIDFYTMIEKLYGGPAECMRNPIYSDYNKKALTKYPAILNYIKTIDTKKFDYSLLCTVQGILCRQEYIYRSKFCRNTILKSYHHGSKNVKTYKFVKKYMHDRTDKDRMINDLFKEMDDIYHNIIVYDSYLEINTLYDLFDTYLSELDMDIDK